MAYFVSGTVVLGIWAKKAGVWVKITTQSVELYESVAGAGSYTVNWDVTYDVDLGTAVQAFGVTVDSYDGTAAALTDFVSVAWTGTSATGDRSATPSSQNSTVTVRPQ
jgi:hypothetical protein